MIDDGEVQLSLPPIMVPLKYELAIPLAELICALYRVLDPPFPIIRAPTPVRYDPLVPSNEVPENELPVSIL